MKFAFTSEMVSPLTKRLVASIEPSASKLQYKMRLQLLESRCRCPGSSVAANIPWNSVL